MQPSLQLGHIFGLRILSPLGMNSTRISLTKPLESRLAIGHRNGHQLPIIEDPPPYAPAGGFRSTALDMAKYLAASMGLTKTNLSSAMELSDIHISIVTILNLD